MANPNIDLAALTVQRSAEPELRLPRRWFSRLVLPVGLIAGFAGLMLWASWDSIAPAVEVRITPCRTISGGSTAAAGQELFKANGWIEPRPLPIDVPVQTEGMYRVAEVMAIPGDRVKAGQLLVKLDDERARLDYDAAKAKLARREAAVRSAQADESKAQIVVKNAEAAIEFARKEGASEVQVAVATVTRAEAMREQAVLQLKVEEDLRKSGSVVPEIRLEKAKQQVAVADAEVKVATANCEKAKTGAEVRVRQAELAASSAAAERISLAARAAQTTHEVADAAVEVTKAELELSRTKIVAPVAGVIMALNVRVGSVMGGKNTAIEHKDAAVTLYDPTKLQVRVEVPIGKFAFVQNGSPATIELDELMPGVKLQGTVLADVHFANIARNSVPVKVALADNPPTSLRPEMIASVRFMSSAPALPSGDSDKAKTGSILRVTVPRKLLRFDGDRAKVWLVQPATGRADYREVEPAVGEKDKSGETVEIKAGLLPSDRLIASNTDRLTPGCRIRVVGEDQ